MPSTVCPCRSISHVALDGHQALLMMSNPHFHPDLIVLDLNIPKVSGTALLELWKGDRTPVIVLSSSRNPKEREFCLASGAQDYVTKPVELGVPAGCRTNHRTVGSESCFGRSPCVGNFRCRPSNRTVRLDLHQPLEIRVASDLDAQSSRNSRIRKDAVVFVLGHHPSSVLTPEDGSTKRCAG